MNDDLAAAGIFCDPTNKSTKRCSGQQYLYQDDRNGNTDVPKDAEIIDADGNKSLAGTTADFVKVTWENGKIVDVDSYDAYESTQNAEGARKTADHKLTEQTNNVVFVAKDRTQAEEMAALYEGNPHVRVIHAESGFDSGRVWVSPVKPGHIKMPGTFAVVGGATNLLFAGVNIRDYGWKIGVVETGLSYADPLDFRDHAWVDGCNWFTGQCVQQVA